MTGDTPYYLYLEYDRQEIDAISTVSQEFNCKEECTTNNFIENFQVLASETAPPPGDIPCPAIPAENDTSPKQQIKDWLQDQTSQLCSKSADSKIFILVFKKSSENGQIELLPAETENYRTAVTHNRVLSELLACHLADFDNPHKTVVELPDALERIAGVKGDENHNIHLVQKNGSTITITPDPKASKIAIGETHSADTGNVHKTKHSQLIDVLPISGTLKHREDDDKDDNIRDKHISNNDAKKWNSMVGTPKGIKSIDGVSNPGGNIDLRPKNSIIITPDNKNDVITIGETHSTGTGNPHEVKMSQLKDLSANNDNITDLANPRHVYDAANKAYVDKKTAGTINGLKDIVKESTPHKRQINVSHHSTASGNRSQVNASDSSTAHGNRTQINASDSSTAHGNRAQINASRHCTTVNNNTQVNAALRTKTQTDYTVCGGHASSGDSFPANRKWELNSKHGHITYTGNLNTSFSDYGEYFENLEKKKILPGVLIALDGEHVRPAQKNEDFIGVVSGTAAVRLGDSPFCWRGRYMKDQWGRPVYEKIKDPDWRPRTEPDEKWTPKEGQTEDDRPMIAVEKEKDRPFIFVQKENPAYEPEREQVPRSERPEEWTLVGLLGKVYVRCDGTVKPGDYVKSKNKGIGTASAEKTKLKAMKVTRAYNGKYAIVYCLLQ
jgi:hypothetical protein